MDPSDPIFYCDECESRVDQWMTRCPYCDNSLEDDDE